jgi:hypothetical protein
MTDKEMMVLAAKAAGYQIQGEIDSMVAQPGHLEGGFVISNAWGGSSLWNSLTDDGDALRLAIKLNISIGFDGDALLVNGRIHAYNIEDRAAATRRAITRAAAEIGKAMP